MQNNSPKIPLIIATAFFCVSVFLFVFLYRQINNNNQKSQIAENALQMESNRRDEIKALDQSIKIIESERAELETHFAKSSDIVPFLNTIEGLASKVGAKAEVISVNILDDRTGLLVGMKASGTFNGLYKFLTLLENSPYELEFGSMDLAREEALDSAENIATVPGWNATFRIKLLTFIP